MAFVSNGRKLYLAYGSNANLANMSSRCPRAIAIGRVSLPGYELVFKGVANIRPKRNANVYCVLWSITFECEGLLDWYEEYPRLYLKKYIKNRKYGIPMMTYILKHSMLNQYPADSYVKCIEAGYKTFDIPQKQLVSALDRSTRGKNNLSYTPRFNYKV